MSMEPYGDYRDITDEMRDAAFWEEVREAPDRADELAWSVRASFVIEGGRVMEVPL